MTGWKTWASAIGTMATGIGVAISGVTGEQIDPTKVYEGILIFMAGLALIGIGHKIEKKGSV